MSSDKVELLLLSLHQREMVVLEAFDARPVAYVGILIVSRVLVSLVPVTLRRELTLVTVRREPV